MDYLLEIDKRGKRFSIINLPKSFDLSIYVCPEVNDSYYVMLSSYHKERTASNNKAAKVRSNIINDGWQASIFTSAFPKDKKQYNYVLFINAEFYPDGDLVNELYSFLGHNIESLCKENIIKTIKPNPEELFDYCAEVVSHLNE